MVVSFSTQVGRGPMGSREMDIEQIEELAAEYNTTKQYIYGLLNGGVCLGDIQGVLDVRQDHIVVYVESDEYDPHRNLERDEMISAHHLIQLYRMAQGELDLMVSAVERAESLVMDWHDRRDVRRGAYKRALQQVIDQGVSMLYG